MRNKIKLLKQLALETLFGGSSDTTAPSVATFTVTSPSISLDVTITAFTATDNVAVTGYQVTENNTPPTAGGAGWSASAPATYTVSANGTYTLYPWVKDAAGNVSSEFASPRTVVVLALPFSDAFTRADGAIGGQWTGATWTISSNAALNTPTPGNELLQNGSFTAWTGDDPDNWSLLGGAEDGNNYITEVSGKARIVAQAGTTHFYLIYQNIGIALNKWYQISFNLTARVAGAIRARFGGDAWAPQDYTTTGVKVFTVRPTTTPNGNFFISTNGDASDFTFDDASVKELTPATLFAVLPSVGVASVTAQVLVASDPTNHRAGLVINLDSASNPQNFVIAYLDDTTAKLVKCVAGTYTTVISGSVTWGAAKILKVVKNGNTYQLWYDGTQVGTDQTIASMNGTIHGLFSTNSSPKLDSYQLSATP